MDIARAEALTLREDLPAVLDAAEQTGADQAALLLGFLRTLQAGGLSQDQALWLTAQVWRAG